MHHKMRGDGLNMLNQIPMRGISFGCIRMFPFSRSFAQFSYPLTFVMAMKVINTNIEREIALQTMQRLNSCYNNVIEILKSNKVNTTSFSSYN